ncbi:MAG: phosphoserine phosphatase SerB [Pseudomonadota bacterium]
MAVFRLVSSHKAHLESCPFGVPSPLVALHDHLFFQDTFLDSEHTEHLTRWASEYSVDVIQPGSYKRSQIAAVVMDMDSTLITIECIDEIADFVGKKPEVAEITEEAMQGKIPFSEALVKRVALLAGLPVSTLEAVYQQRLKLSPGAELMLESFKAVGASTLLVSGGFSFFTDRLKERLGLDAAYANTLEVQNGLLTGRIEGDLVDGATKAQHLLRLKASLVNPSEEATKAIVAIGDGSNDRLMFAEADVGVAYHAKPILESVATYCIRYGGLDTLLAYFSEH